MQIQHLVLEQLLKNPASLELHTLALALGKAPLTQAERRIQLFRPPHIFWSSFTFYAGQNNSLPKYLKNKFLREREPEGDKKWVKVHHLIRTVQIFISY